MPVAERLLDGGFGVLLWTTGLFRRWMHHGAGLGSDRVHSLHSFNAMPTLVRLANGNVTMYAADHQPPHFHVRARDGREALVVISTLAVFSGATGAARAV